MILQRLERRWDGPCIVAATGPSLDSHTADACRETPIIAVNDAYKLLPFADVLYGCDEVWWDTRKPVFSGEKWSSHNDGERPRNNKRRAAKRHSLRVVEGKQKSGFSLDPSCIHYGFNGGFQAVNLAILWGGNPIILVGFDMRGTHFFGPHQPPLRQKHAYHQWIRAFEEAAKLLPDHIKILNATPGSALTCFPVMTLAEALSEIRRAGPQDINREAYGCA